MKTVACLLICLASMSPASAAADRTTLTYHAVRGTTKTPHQITFEGKNPDSALRLVVADFPSPIQNLPVWLPPGFREVGAVLYDDGEGFTYDRGHEVYVLERTEKWNTFDVVCGSYWYQGMQPQDHWRLEAKYDRASGYLVSATVRTRLGRGTRVVFDLTLSAVPR